MKYRGLIAEVIVWRRSEKQKKQLTVLAFQAEQSMKPAPRLGLCQQVLKYESHEKENMWKPNTSFHIFNQ